VVKGRGGGDAEIVRRFGESIRRHRLSKGLSQEALADRARVHRTYVGRVERGEANATLTTIVKLAAALDVEPTDLLTEL
jgi:transcriptional regulator with XRE-family HTH domain